MKAWKNERMKGSEKKKGNWEKEIKFFVQVGKILCALYFWGLRNHAIVNAIVNAIAILEQATGSIGSMPACSPRDKSSNPAQGKLVSTAI